MKCNIHIEMYIDHKHTAPWVLTNPTDLCNQHPDWESEYSRSPCAPSLYHCLSEDNYYPDELYPGFELHINLAADFEQLSACFSPQSILWVGFHLFLMISSRVNKLLYSSNYMQDAVLIN